MQPIEERLELVRFKVDKTAHIRVNTEACQGCDTTPCVFVCPAGLFELLGGEMHFSYSILAVAGVSASAPPKQPLCLKMHIPCFHNRHSCK